MPTPRATVIRPRAPAIADHGPSPAWKLASAARTARVPTWRGVDFLPDRSHGAGEFVAGGGDVGGKGGRVGAGQGGLLREGLQVLGHRLPGQLGSGPGVLVDLVLAGPGPAAGEQPGPVPRDASLHGRRIGGISRAREVGAVSSGSGGGPVCFGGRT